MRRRGTWIFVAALCTCAAIPLPATAVDRTLGRDVPKPGVSGSPWTPAQRLQLARDIDETLVTAPTLKGAHLGVLAIDARDGTSLYAHNADDALMPASTFKLLTGSAALERLGPAFRFRTSASIEGPVTAGELKGRLVVRGGGDPFLGVAEMDDLASTLERAGVRRISGPIEIDTSLFSDPPYMPGWSWDDFPYYYAPKISALSFDDNVVHLTIVPATAAGRPPQISAMPYGRLIDPRIGCAVTSDTAILNRAVTGAAKSPDSIDIARDPDGCIVVGGSIAADAPPDTIDAAIPSPETHAWHVLTDRLEAHHIRILAPTATAGFPQIVIGAPAGTSARNIWTHDSEPLSDLLADLWFPSDNLLAELLLRALGAADGRPGTVAKGIAYEMSWLRQMNVDVAPISIDDGSGLSAYDRLTPSALVAILAHDWNGPNRDIVLDDLPIAGVRGTLKSLFVGTPAAGTVFGKTGSVSHVRTLAGYAATQTHGTVIFAFQVGDWNGKPDDINAVRAAVLSRIITDR